MKLQTDYMLDNVLARLRRLEQRLAALERRGQGGASGESLATTDAAPAGALPAAGSISPLYLVERTTGDLYELICETRGGRVRLLLRRVGPLRREE